MTTPGNDDVRPPMRSPLKALLRGLLAIALVMGLGIAALLWQASTMPRDAAMIPQHRADSDAAPAPPAPDQMMRMLQGDGGDFSLLPPGATPRDALPLDLPLIETAEPALKLASYETNDGGLVEQAAIWSLPAVEADRVQAFYDERLRQAGFTPGTPESAATPHNRVYYRGEQTLLLRIRPTGAKTRLTILLRYTEAADSAASGR